MHKMLFNFQPDLGLFIHRVAFSLFMAFAHGLPKLAAFGDKMDSFPDPLGVSSPVSLALAVFSEFFCALAVALGLYVRLAVIPLIITMVVAAFIVHAGDPFGQKELALVYLVGFTTLFFTGGGKVWALDSKLGG